MSAAALLPVPPLIEPPTIAARQLHRSRRRYKVELRTVKCSSLHSETLPGGCHHQHLQTPHWMVDDFWCFIMKMGVSGSTVASTATDRATNNSCKKTVSCTLILSPGWHSGLRVVRLTAFQGHVSAFLRPFKLLLRGSNVIRPSFRHRP